MAENRIRIEDRIQTEDRMRTNEERIAAMHARAAEIRQKQRAGRVRVMQTVSAAASFAAVILLAVFMPKIKGNTGPDADAVDMQASILGDSGAVDYVVIAIVAFLLGAAVTAFCYKLKGWPHDRDS